MTAGLGFTTALKCLSEAEKLIGLKAEDWKAIGVPEKDFQWFLENQAAWRAGLANFEPEDLRGFATPKLDELLAKMKEWEMKVDPPEEGPDGSVYAISKLLEKIMWKVTGKKAKSRGMFPEFVLHGGLEYYANDFSAEPLWSIMTENGDLVWITRWTEEISGLALPRTISEIIRSKSAWKEGGYSKVQIPCIKAEMKPSLAWIISTMKNKHWYVFDAKQLIRFGMNEKGFVVLEETSMDMAFEMVVTPKVPYIVSPKGEGFLFGRTRKGVDFPVSSFHFTKDAYKDPGNLDDVVK